MVCFETAGTGQFMPCAGANPAIGEVGELTRVDEIKVEVLCVDRDVMLGSVDALKRYVPSLCFICAEARDRGKGCL